MPFSPMHGLLSPQAAWASRPPLLNVPGSSPDSFQLAIPTQRLLTVPATTVPAPAASPSGPLPSRPLRVALLGATGAVGQELLQLLEERRFPVAEIGRAHV